MTKTAKSKSKKGVNGKGTVWREGNRFRWQCTLGYTSDPTPKRLHIGGSAATEQEAWIRISEVKADHHRKILAMPDDITVAEYAERWLGRHYDIEARTVHKYGTELRYALEYIGKLRVQDVEPHNLHDVMARLAQRPMKHGKPISRQTLGRIRTRLNTMFNDAVIDKIIYQNPMIGVKKIKVEINKRAKIKALNFEQEARFLAVGAALHRAGLCQLWPALELMLRTGFRRGETAGLMWSDINYQTGTITITRARVMDVQGIKTASTKTQSSDRVLPVPPQVLELLDRQKEQQRQQRRQLPEAWKERDIVFATNTGDWTHPDNFNRALRSIIAWSDPDRVAAHEAWIRVPLEQRSDLQRVIVGGSKLPHISCHDLRHTYATLALRRKIDVNVVSKALGHKSVAITLEIYRHVSDDEIRAAIAQTFQPPPTPPPLPNRILN